VAPAEEFKYSDVARYSGDTSRRIPAAKIATYARASNARTAAGVATNSLSDYLQSRVRARRGGLVVKRTTDIVGALLALILLSPLLLMVAIAVSVSSRGSPFFVQTRVGLGGARFRAYKFRSYYSDKADAGGISQPGRNDPRITPLGHVLRRTSIDELPQLWNVVKGDMSLVGPRPHVPGILAATKPYETLVPAYELRHLVKPGLTGLAQSRGFRGPTHEAIPARMRIACDLAYISEMSFRLDLAIMIQTIRAELGSGSQAQQRPDRRLDVLALTIGSVTPARQLGSGPEA
jgi:lipopolysaccharide/colanic/teichoic acid biosynthesis glycosyltransferase